MVLLTTSGLNGSQKQPPFFVSLLSCRPEKASNIKAFCIEIYILGHSGQLLFWFLNKCHGHQMFAQKYSEQLWLPLEVENFLFLNFKDFQTEMCFRQFSSILVLYGA